MGMNLLRGRRLLGAAALSLAPLLAVSGVASASSPSHHQRFTEVDLVSNLPGRAPLVDPSLVNPWGLSFTPTSPLWVSNAGANNATLYAGGIDGATPAKAPLTVDITGGAPTGQVANDTTDFVVTGPGGSGAAKFMFVSLSGNVLAWNPTASPTTALVMKHVPGAEFTGMALLHTGHGNFILATDFHHGTVDVFNSKFQQVHLPRAFFADRRLPRGYAPFNVAVLGDSVYVTYAKQDAQRQREVVGRHLGFVDRYSSLGLGERRVASRDTLNAPWGLAIAPSSFGTFAGDLLVGDFGDGRINVYDHGRFAGQVKSSSGRTIAIPGLWALLPGTATTGGVNNVWFSAGIQHETAGLVGLIRPAIR
ncbi:MAG TPA: TIGR03118 family protein [Mycobacteriales bacterium]|nr:TIGR03118 family protein [Mycobacteriales bacterium]